MLTLALAAAPFAVASPCGSNTNPHEMFFENFGGWSLNVYDGNGNLVPATFWDGNGNQLPNEDWPYLIPGRPDCDLVIENNGHNGHQHIKLDVDGVAIFELSPTAGGSGTGDDAGYLMFAYGIGSSDTFYEPNGSYGTTVNGDVFVLRDGLSLRFSLSWMWSPPSGIRYVDEFFPDDTWVMPYEADVVCVGMGGSPSTCDLRYEEGQFITLQTNWPAAEYQNPTYRFSGLTDIERHEDIVENWNTTPMTLEFPQGTRFIANGRFGAEGVTFTEAASGQGWDGIRVAGDDGSLDFDGVIVEHAEVGIEVRSGTNAIHTNTIRNTLLTDNGVGILADFASSGLVPARSSFVLRESCVVNSTTDLGDGHGIWGRWTDAFIVNTTVEDNDGYGVSFENADLNIAHGLLVTGNGAGSQNFNDGVRSGPSGDVTLASPFGGSGYDVGPGRNSIHDNTEDEIDIDENGYATVGALCTSLLGGGCPTTNRVSEGGFPGDGDFLIANEPNTTIPAQRVYWATPFPNPPDAAFLQPTLVDDGSALSSDPASDAGRTLGCERSTFIGSGIGGLGRSASAASRAAQAFGGGSSGEGRELDPETAAWLRARIVAMRAALAENPAADTSAALLGRLYGLQRLDRTDALGEHAATMGLLASLRARLAGEGSLPPALRATAEAALVAGVHDLMRGEDYEAARTVVAALAPRAEAERTRLAMALADAALDEVGGDYASAIGKYNRIIETLGPEHAQLARDLAATVALLERRQNGGDLRAGNPMGNPTGEASAVQAAMGEAPSTFGLGSAYPNPFNPVAVVPFALDASADVRLSVYDVLGRRVALLADGRYEAGAHTLRFDASALPSGTYLVRMTATPESGSVARTFTERITLLR